jgi:hypothetical protein
VIVVWINSGGGEELYRALVIPRHSERVAIVGLRTDYARLFSLLEKRRAKRFGSIADSLLPFETFPKSLCHC